MGFPEERPRRLRRTPALRALAREARLSPGQLIQPLFVVEGEGIREPIRSMPGIERFAVDRVVEEVKEVERLGVAGVILFGVPGRKDELGSGAWDPDGVVQRALRRIKDAAPDLLAIADVCLCEYTDHGHCGVLEGGHVHNDATLPLLARAAVSLAEAGADVVAPSDMMDGRVAAIRRALDAAGRRETPILSYAAKYASAFYGPFREAAESAPQVGDRRGYQMDPANAREAMKEVALDVAQGADILMVKPAMPYLDLVSAVRHAWDLPVAAYQVSGEYAMIHAAAANGWLDLRRCALEALTGIKRAGADMILTYFAKDACRWISER
jgi:porphobilinogen synthase